MRGEFYWRIKKPGVSRLLVGLPNVSTQRIQHFLALEGASQPGLTAFWEMRGQKDWEALHTVL